MLDLVRAVPLYIFLIYLFIRTSHDQNSREWLSREGGVDLEDVRQGSLWLHCGYCVDSGGLGVSLVKFWAASERNW